MASMSAFKSILTPFHAWDFLFILLKCLFYGLSLSLFFLLQLLSVLSVVLFVCFLFGFPCFSFNFPYLVSFSSWLFFFFFYTSASYSLVYRWLCISATRDVTLSIFCFACLSPNILCCNFKATFRNVLGWTPSFCRVFFFGFSSQINVQIFFVRCAYISYPMLAYTVYSCHYSLLNYCLIVVELIFFFLPLMLCYVYRCVCVCVWLLDK